MKKNQEDILFYWSGEADAETSRRVEELIERDAEARAYYEELRELKTLWKSGEEKELAAFPPRRPDLLDEVLHEEALGRKPDTNGPSPFWWRNAAFIAAAAAVLMIIAATAFLLFRSNSPGEDSIASIPAEHEEKIVDTPVIIRIPLSQRLLTESESFQRSDASLDSARKNRERRAKLRTNQYKS